MLSCISKMDENSPTKPEKGTTPSPITDIVRGLMKSRLSTQNCLQSCKNETEESQHTREDLVGTRYLSERGLGGPKETNRRLFKDAFKFKSTPENPIKARPRGRRLLGMASRRFLGPEPVSPSVEKENGNTGRSSRGSSPHKMPQWGKKCRNPLEDCDPNSQDSGYEASYPEKEEKPREVFRFLEPMAVAPRRTSIECRSPIESPIRSSPQHGRAIRPSLFRTISSGYESMDDGFNDLIDVEPLEDCQVTQYRLPNGISTLLSGDIVTGHGTESSVSLRDVSSSAKMDTTSSPSTPEFPRTNRNGNFRRSLFLENERQETRKNSSLSKVRSCLFRSPNASPASPASPAIGLAIGLAKPGFDDSPLTHHRLSSPSTSARAIETVAVVPASYRRRVCYRDELSRNTDGNGNIDSLLPVNVKTFKRPDPPIDDSPKLVKKSRRSGSIFSDTIPHCCTIDTPTSSPLFAGIPLQRSLSETSATIAIVETTTTTTMETMPSTDTEIEIETESHALIESAIRRSTTDTDLTGDFSKPCILPLVVGRHEDLKSISADTLAALIRGEFDDRIGSFQIVDCRYPYEFDAGHIRTALNLYSKDLIERNLLDPLNDTPEIQPDTNKRNILVFHCEFSWERGPNLSRFLRNLDRQRNKECYPALHYPEVYLLHGGYEQFYKEQKELCSPQGYRPMRHPDHETDLRKFRNKSKSWQGEKSRITGSATRSNLKRLGF